MRGVKSCDHELESSAFNYSGGLLHRCCGLRSRCTSRVLSSRILDFASGVHLVFGGDGRLRWPGLARGYHGAFSGFDGLHCGLVVVAAASYYRGGKCYHWFKGLTRVRSGPEPAALIVVNSLLSGGWFEPLGLTVGSLNTAAMGKRQRKLTAAEKRARKRRRKEFMMIFVNGKQKRVRRPQKIDGIDVDEFIRRNADPIWLHQNGLWEYINDNEPF